MKDDLKSSLLTVCNLLQKYKVQYVLVGGTAVALYGYYRHSINISGELTAKPDIDIWYNPTYENYFAILKVMEKLGLDISEFKDEQAPNPHKSFFKLDFEDFSCDVLPEIKANIKFADAYKRKESVEVNGTPIHFMGYTDLIEDKEATTREKDLKDIEQLKNIKGEREK